ncbi:MAG TPA: twin-arginine translocase subunit TatC [Prosthecobacter sp.]|nr:twin-arginine translocase subunit TatC [Prosthecobacter sp.]
MWHGLLNKVFKIRDKVAMNLGKDDEEKPFLEHLDDLRKMLVRIVITLLVTVLITFGFHKWLMVIIKLPLAFAGLDSNLININPPAAFMTAVNVSLIAAIIISFPVILIFIMQFVLPGLKENEKKLMFPALAVGTGLFLTGVFFSYFIVLPRALLFFDDFGRSIGIGQTWTLEAYVTFATRFILIFGISFELPVVVMALVKLDFLGYETMKKTRKHAVIFIAIFSAVVTPTQDILTLLLLSAPLYVLYEICIWLARYLEKKDRAAYPEYYEQIDKDAKELEKEVKDDWDNENYNPWFSEDDREDEEDEYQRPRATPSAPPPEVEKAPASPSEEIETGEDQSSQVVDEESAPETPPPPAGSGEKTLEELSREDELRSGNPKE